jgi:preprotein translocase subunit SecD
MNRRDLWNLIFIIVLTIAGLWVVWPTNPENYLPGVVPWPRGPGVSIHLGSLINFERRDMRLGLDLQGGTYIVLEADLSGVPEAERDGRMEGVRRIIERRINAYGVAEAVVARQGENRIVLQLPGVRDVQEAKELVGRTAQLDFRECRPIEQVEAAQCIRGDGRPGEWVPARAAGSDGVLKQLTGAYLRPNAQVVVNPTTGVPEVAFEWDSEGARLFEAITQRNLEQPLGIFLDNGLISAPRVTTVIRDRGVITGLTLQEARLLAIQLNAGALPVPVHIVQEQDVDATLGADSIRKSILAGELAFLVVVLFMVLYYRFPGVIASIALGVYAVLLLALFKLIPVTLTLAGIAAFILSLGMAVDANILVFERMKEEMRAGRPIRAALIAGFERAWPSIRDSNAATLITCAILYWFGSNFAAPLVQGFALTLALGVGVSLFTAIIVSRTFLRLAINTPLGERRALFVP